MLGAPSAPCFSMISAIRQSTTIPLVCDKLAKHLKGDALTAEHRKAIDRRIVGKAAADQRLVEIGYDLDIDHFSTPYFT